MAAVLNSLPLEQALNESEGVFFVFTEEGRLLKWNRQANEVTGYTDEEIAEMHPTEFVPNEERDEVQKQIDTVLTEGQTRFQTYLQTKDGEQIPCELSGLLLDVGDTKLICATGHLVVQGPEDAPQASRERRDSEIFDERYRRLFETSQDGIVLTTPAGEIIDANPALCEIAGYTCDELVGQQASTLYDSTTRQKLVRALQDKGRVTDLELPLRRKDGETRICLVSATLWTDNEGNAQAIQSVVRDVTEQRQLQRDMLRVQEEERRRLGQDLHDGVAAQLTGVAMMLNSLKTTLEEEHPELSSRVDQLLDLVIESNKDLRRVSRGLNPMVLEEEGLLPALERLANNTAVGRLEVGEEDDNFKGLYPKDERQLYWIAQEAVANARRHGEADEIVLRLGSEGGDFILEVEDDGVGFNPSGTDEEGLGLRSMRHRADLLGADFTIESSPEEGTHVRCRLPV